MKTCCVVVIGHVDHGKTALVHALTGMETDRLAEEKARGLSILPGYAHKRYAGGIVDFIDAPGHEDFIQAMVSGASGAGAALVVVSAREGIAAQTREHLEIAGHLGIARGLIAVTKADLLPPQERAARLDSLCAQFAQTSLAHAPMVLCSAVTGEGIGEMHLALEALIADTRRPRAPASPTLAIDRVFSLTGQGTIVTGTLLGGALHKGDEAILHPSGQHVTLRGLHSRGESRDSVQPAERVAVNLRGVAVPDIPRGAVLCPQGAASRCFDVALRLRGSSAKPLRHMQEVRVLFGTTSEVARVHLFGRSALEPGQEGFAQLRFTRAVFAYEGQRAVLRQLSPAATIGGATFLDPQAQQTRAGDKARVQVLQAIASGAPSDVANALMDTQGGVARLADVARLAGDVPQGSGFVPLDAEHMTRPKDIEAARQGILSALARHHAAHPLQAMAPRAVIERRSLSPLLTALAEAALLAENLLRRQGNRLALASHDPHALLTEAQSAELAAIDMFFRHAGLSADHPAPDQFAPDLMAFLADQGRLIHLRNVALNQTLVLHADVLDTAARALAAAFPQAAPFTTSQARIALGTSRKVIVPVLEHFDSIGITQRDADVRRIAGAIGVPPPP